MAWENEMKIKADGKKRIIVQQGKHGNDYYDASTQEAADASFVKIFKSNHDIGYYGDVKDRAGELETEVRELEQQAKPLPPGLSAAHYKLSEEAAVKLKRVKRDLAEATEEAELLARAEKGDVDAVKEFLRSRKDGEYEGFQVEVLQ